MDDRELFEREQAGLAAFYRRLIAPGSRSSRLIERGDVVAAVVPIAPERSFCNGVVPQSSQGLSNALEALASAYQDAGVRAWTVWVPASDTRSTLLLEQSGHRLDATPAAMALELTGFEPTAKPVEFDAAPRFADIGAINDVAYDYGGDDFARSIADLPDDAAHLYVTRVDRTPVACAVALDHEGDCVIGMVATLPEARGRGLAAALMTQALLDARERGCETSTLQATKMGKPIYERMGYRDLGPLHMWERRSAAP
jgi:GNAT superfamily N-acetyltransferase